MADPNEPQSWFLRAFLPGLLVGLVVGLGIGAFVPPLLDQKRAGGIVAETEGVVPPAPDRPRDARPGQETPPAQAVPPAGEDQEPPPNVLPGTAVPPPSPDGTQTVPETAPASP